MTAVQSSLPQARSTLRRSAHGFTFDLLDDVWMLRADGRRVSINWSYMVDLATSPLEMEMRKSFARIVSVNTATTCLAYFNALKDVLLYTKAREEALINCVSADAFAGWLSTQPGPAKISQIKALFKIWRNLRGEGIDTEALDLAERVNVPRSDDYSNVLTWDSDYGPYRPSEDEAIRIALDDAFNEGEISIEEY